jgi:hypothetical protein
LNVIEEVGSDIEDESMRIVKRKNNEEYESHKKAYEDQKLQMIKDEEEYKAE